MDTPQVGNWLETRSGTKFTAFDPKPTDIILSDVAFALSRICRYGGHTRRWYSVAEHACLISDLVAKQSWSTPRDALTALHHDDSEAYIGDLVAPLKQGLPQFKDLERPIDAAIAQRFGTEYPFPGWLKTLDLIALKDERLAVMRPSGNRWEIDQFDPLGLRFWEVGGRFQFIVRRRWLSRHHRLMKLIESGAPAAATSAVSGSQEAAL